MLYLNSLNFTSFQTDDLAIATIRGDVARVVGCEVEEISARLIAHEPPALDPSQWTNIDEPADALLDLDTATIDAEEKLGVSGDEVEEQLWTRLLRSLCPVTGQPHWGTLLVSYRGRRIDRDGLLRYVCSLRAEAGFNEQIVEQIFLALTRRCAPAQLMVTGRFMRRGGIDINPVRKSARAQDDPVAMASQRAAVMEVEQIRAPGQ